MKFIMEIEIEMDNAAFGDDADSREGEAWDVIKDAMTTALDRTDFSDDEGEGFESKGTIVRLFDSNGNAVGSLETFLEED